METRRDFIKMLSLAVAGSWSNWAEALPTENPPKKSGLRFALCADVHKDIMHDADKRLATFIDSAQKEELDFIIQLGDFCCPQIYNQDFLNIWNQYPGKKYHVIGNHDMDGGFTKEQVLAFWGAEGKYYSFDCKKFHCVVLDGNDQDPSPNRPAGYARYIGPEQLNWLEKDLAQTDLPTLVFCHQGLDNDMGGIHNASRCRLVLEKANQKAGFQKVQLVFSGHHHQDYYNQINGIHYIQINSMSYHWLGEAYQRIRYSEAVNQTHPWIKYTVPYEKPLWAIAEISNKQFQLLGQKSTFVGPTPQDIGVDMEQRGYPIVPFITDKKIRLGKFS